MGLWFNKVAAEHNPLNTTYLQLVLSWDLNKDFSLFLLYPYKELVRLSSSTAPRFFQTLTMCETQCHAKTYLFKYLATIPSACLDQTSLTGLLP